VLERVLGALGLLFVAATARAQGGVTVSVCYSEFPGSSCSGVEAPFHQPTLEGPLPSGAARTPEPFEFGETYYRFLDVAPGNYIVRESGPCNPFGCFLDTPVSVSDEDVYLRVQQIGGQTPTLTPTGPAIQPTPPTPTATATSSSACRCLQNGGVPGPGDCPCDVEQCYRRCVDTLCPDYPDCTFECSFRCSCNSAGSGCQTHVDPGPTPTMAPPATVNVPCVGDANDDDRVTIDELVEAVSNALVGCPPK
jgi:hypothetical protein